MIQLWQNFPCLFITSCVDYKRHGKRAAALQALKAKLEEQFNDSFTGRFHIYLSIFSFLQLSLDLCSLIKIKQKTALNCCMENKVFLPTL